MFFHISEMKFRPQFRLKLQWKVGIYFSEGKKWNIREENVGEIGGASGGGAEFAENGNDEIVRQGIEQVTLSSDIRRIPASFPVTNLFGGEISPSLHNSHVLVFNNSRVTKPSPCSHISFFWTIVFISLYLSLLFFYNKKWAIGFAFSAHIQRLRLINAGTRATVRVRFEAAENWN